MESINKELIRLGIDPTLISDENFVRLQIACEETGEEAFLVLRTEYSRAVTEHNELVNAITGMIGEASATVLSLADLPLPPKRGFRAACARMLADIDAIRETTFGQLMCELSALRARLVAGKQTRLGLAKERSLLHLASKIRRTEASIPDEEEILLLFGNELESKLLRLTALLCEVEAFLADLALSAARTAKRVDQNEAKSTEYARLLDGARIRLHDLSVAIGHIRKEIDHVKIHTCA